MSREVTKMCIGKECLWIDNSGGCEFVGEKPCVTDIDFKDDIVAGNYKKVGSEYILTKAGEAILKIDDVVLEETKEVTEIIIETVKTEKFDEVLADEEVIVDKEKLRRRSKER